MHIGVLYANMYYLYMIYVYVYICIYLHVCINYFAVSCMYSICVSLLRVLEY